MGVVLCDLTKSRLGCVEGKRMQQRDSFFELFLNLCIAGNGEVDRTELLLGQRVMLVLPVEGRRHQEK